MNREPGLRARLFPVVSRRWLPLLILLTIGAAAAAEGRIDPRLLEAGWRELTFEDKPANRFELVDDGAIRVASEGSVSILQRPVQVDLEANPILTWRWRVDEAVPPTDLTRKGGDDRSLALFVTFPFRPGEASFFERLKRGMVEMVAGEDAPGRVISYVFGGQGARGEIQESPYYGSAGANVILRPAGAASGTWFEERIDVAAAYRQVFGSAPDAPTHIGITADSDDTGTRALGLIEGISFEPR